MLQEKVKVSRKRQAHLAGVLDQHQEEDCPNHPGYLIKHAQTA